MSREILTDSRTPLSIAFFAVAAMILAAHTTGRIFPWVLVVFFIGLAALVLLAAADNSFVSILGSAIIIGVSYRLVVNLFTTPIGSSPQTQPARMDLIAETGSVAESGTGFYGDAPIHFLNVGMSSLVFDLSSYDAILIYAILIGVLLPLIAINLSKLVGIDDNQLLLFAAILAVCTTEAVRRSYWLVPQSSGSIYFWIAILVLALYVQSSDRRLFAIFALVAGVLTFTHKLQMTVLSAILLGLLGLVIADKLTWDDLHGVTPEKQILGVLGFIWAVTGLQWLYVGPIINTVIARVLRTFTETGAITRSVDLPSAAVEVQTGLILNYFITTYPSELSLFAEQAHGVWLLLFAGVGWLVFYFKRTNRPYRSQVQLLLAVSAVCVAILPIGVAAIRGLNPTRILILIEPMLVVLVIGVVRELRKSVSIGMVAKVFVIVLVATQIFAASAAPDYANSPRYYADTSEAHAEATMCTYFEEPVYLDDYYSRYVDSNYDNCEVTSAIGRTNDSPLFNAGITPGEHEVFAYRHDPDVYLGDRGNRWRLSWHPDEELSQEYHAVLDNGGVTTFYAPEDARN